MNTLPSADCGAGSPEWRMRLACTVHMSYCHGCSDAENHLTTDDWAAVDALVPVIAEAVADALVGLLNYPTTTVTPPVRDLAAE